MIDWKDKDYAAQGYFWATLASVSIECADAQHDADVTGYAYAGNDTEGVPMVSFVTQDTTIPESAIVPVPAGPLTSGPQPSIPAPAAPPAADGASAPPAPTAGNGFRAAQPAIGLSAAVAIAFAAWTVL